MKLALNVASVIFSWKKERGHSEKAISLELLLCRLCFVRKSLTGHTNGCLLLSLNLDQVVAVKFLFGLPDEKNATDGASEEIVDYINKLTSILSSKIDADDYVGNYEMRPLYQV